MQSQPLMKQAICRMLMVCILVLALPCAGTAEEKPVEMRIVSCPEQGFSTLSRPEYDYGYTPDGGVTIDLGEANGGATVSIFKTDAPGRYFNAETYLNNAYLTMLRATYGKNILNEGNYSVSSVQGVEMPSRLVYCLDGGEIRARFCAFDLRETCFVRYEVVSPQDDATFKKALTAMAVAIGNFKEDADYYGGATEPPAETEPPRTEDDGLVARDFPELGFSTRLDASSPWKIQNRTLTVYTEKEGSIPYLTIIRSNDLIFEAFEYIREQVTPYVKNQYGDDLISYQEYEAYDIGGKSLPAASYVYRVGDHTVVMLRVFDSTGPSTVAYMAKYLKNDDGATLRALEAAIRNFRRLDSEPGSGATAAPQSRPTATPMPAPTASPTPTPSPTPSPTPTASPRTGGAILSWKGFEVFLERYEINRRDNDNSSLRIYARLVNNTTHRIWLRIENAKVNGVPVDGIGVVTIEPGTDTGIPSNEYLLFKDDGKSSGAGDRAIQRAASVAMTLALDDKSTRETLYLESVRVDLAALEDASPATNPPATRKPAATAKPTDAVYGNYRTLMKGDSGEDVRRLQKRLIELGYLNDKADGQYGSKTAAAVKGFNKENGFGSDSKASVRMQERLYSPAAKAYSEPWIPIDIPRTEWKNNKNAKGASYRFKVTNESKKKTIKGIELQYCITDVWGDNLWEYSYRKTTFPMKIKPGKSAYTSWFYMTPAWSQIDKIHIGVSKIVFTDGTIHENYDFDYDWTCTLH